MFVCARVHSHLVFVVGLACLGSIQSYSSFFCLLSSVTSFRFFGSPPLHLSPPCSFCSEDTKKHFLSFLAPTGSAQSFPRRRLPRQPHSPTGPFISLLPFPSSVAPFPRCLFSSLSADRCSLDCGRRLLSLFSSSEKHLPLPSLSTSSVSSLLYRSLQRHIVAFCGKCSCRKSPSLLTRSVRRTFKIFSTELLWRDSFSAPLFCTS